MALSPPHTPAAGRMSAAAAASRPTTPSIFRRHQTLFPSSEFADGDASEPVSVLLEVFGLGSLDELKGASYEVGQKLPTLRVEAQLVRSSRGGRGGASEEVILRTRDVDLEAAAGGCRATPAACLIGGDDEVVLSIFSAARLVAVRRLAQPELLEAWAASAGAGASACDFALACDRGTLAAFLQGGAARQAAAAAGAGGGSLLFTSPGAADGAGSRPGTAPLPDAAAARLAAAGLGTPPSDAVLVRCSLTARFRSAGVLALRIASVSGLPPRKPGARCCVRSTLAAPTAAAAAAAAVPASRATAPSATPLPAASWPADMASSILYLWIEPQHFAAGAAIEVFEDGGGVSLARGELPLYEIAQPSASAAAPLARSIALSGASGAAASAGASCALEGAFFPAGALRLTLIEARGLGGAHPLDQDVYATLALPSTVRPHAFCTPDDARAGSHPAWKAPFSARVVDHGSAEVRVLARDVFSGDELLGAATIDLSNVFRAPRRRQAWVPLTRPRATSGSVGIDEPAGSIHILAEFTPPSDPPFRGSESLLFPQALTLAGCASPPPAAAAALDRPRVVIAGVDAPPASDAVPPLSSPAAAAAAAGAGGGAPSLALALVAPAASAAAAAAASEAAELFCEADGKLDFSLAQVEEAFDALDLDGNRKVGFMELKHVLACIGEAATEEEIDAMLRLADPSGSGSADFFHVAAIAMHSNPAAPRFDVNKLAAKLRADMIASGAITGLPSPVADARRPATPESSSSAHKPVTSTLEARENARQRMELKQRKQAACAAFVRTYQLRMPQLKNILVRAEESAAFARQDGYVSRREFDILFEAAPTSAPAAELFTAYVRSEESASAQAGCVNLREVLLALSGFSFSTQAQRIRFVYDLFDDDGSGTMSSAELREIVKANSFSTDDSIADRKLAVVLRDGTRTGGTADVDLSVADFTALVKRFPNVIFPQNKLVEGMEQPLPDIAGSAAGGGSGGASVGGFRGGQGKA